MSENGEIYTAGKNFTLPPALTALTNFTSVCCLHIGFCVTLQSPQPDTSHFCSRPHHHLEIDITIIIIIITIFLITITIVFTTIFPNLLIISALPST